MLLSKITFDKHIKNILNNDRQFKMIKNILYFINFTRKEVVVPPAISKNTTTTTQIQVGLHHNQFQAGRQSSTK